LYRFATLLGALPVKRREELVRRAQNWPAPLAEEVARIDIESRYRRSSREKKKLKQSGN